MSNSELLDTAELADLLHASERTVIRWRMQRTGPAWIKAGGRVLYRRSDVDAWLDSRRQLPVREVSAA